MYSRFFRWATDRLGENGIIAFITNSSFLDGRSFDGFRKCIEEEFTCAYFIDLGGNVRKISGRDGIFIGEKHTIFGAAAMTGIVISFLIKDNHNNRNKLSYANPFDVHELRQNKLNYLQVNDFKDIHFEHIIPDKCKREKNITNSMTTAKKNLLLMKSPQQEGGHLGITHLIHLFDNCPRSKTETDS